MKKTSGIILSGVIALLIITSIPGNGGGRQHRERMKEDRKCEMKRGPEMKKGPEMRDKQQPKQHMKREHRNNEHERYNMIILPEVVVYG